MEDHKSEYEHSSNYGDTDFGVVGKLGCDSHQHCAEEGCTFTENIIDSEVFARFVLRNDPGKMRSGECLNCPLEDCYEYSKEPEFPCFIQLQGEGSDSDITYDRYRDQICRAIFFRQFSEQDRKWKGNNLSKEQSQKQAVVVNSYIFSVRGCHLNDRIHSINIEEKGEKKIKDGFILAQFFEDISEALKAALDWGAYRFNIVNLFIIF